MHRKKPTSQRSRSTEPLSGVGIGLRHRHFREILETMPAIPWLEVHTENFFSTGSAASQALKEIAAHYPLSAHGVGLSLGSAEGLCTRHLAGVKSFIERFHPVLVSDHLSWSATSGAHVPDLLPVPYTQEAMEVFISNIQQAQDYLGRRILIENPSSYLSFSSSVIPEQEFIVTVAERSGCGILLDINNAYVSCANQGWDVDRYLAAIPSELVGEIHLAGYSNQKIQGRDMLIDTHGSSVRPPVWALFTKAAAHFPVPVLIEWDTDVPELPVLLAERERAATLLTAACS